MTKKWMILITILMLAGVLVSGCTDNADTTAENEIEETTTEDTEEEVETIGEGIDYGVKMEWFGKMNPDELELNRGDTIAWRNGKPQGTYTLISDDGLFENQIMDNNDAYEYTFMTSGTYTFSVQDESNMTLTVTVR
ncbi:hypothetical protein [Methanolobus sp. WCC4]|uniref:hypothetical protein n=1 Tax=Methanolobus sp. WCC4 TaxID=3125784 RepID=UPI0030F51910